MKEKQKNIIPNDFRKSSKVKISFDWWLFAFIAAVIILLTFIFSF